MLTLFTDGSSVSGNPGSVGVGYVIARDGHMLAGRGFYAGRGTNNIGELLGVLHGLRKAFQFLRENENMLLVTDSMYIVNGLGKSDLYAAKRAPNWQLWEALYEELLKLKEYGGKCLVYWVRGHNGTQGNMLCDRLANTAATTHVDQVPVQKPRGAK